MGMSPPAVARRITPANLLRAKVPPFGGPSLAQMQANVDAALEGMRDDGREWLRQGLARLSGLLGQAAAGQPAAAVQAIGRVMRDMRAVAAQLDYPLLAEAADSLCDFVDADPALAAARLDVVQVHLDAVAVILADDLRGRGTAAAAGVVAGLAQTVEKARAAAPAAGDA